MLHTVTGLQSQLNCPCLLKYKNTSYNESPTELSLGFLHRIAMALNCCQKELSVIFCAKVSVKIIVFPHLHAQY